MRSFYRSPRHGWMALLGVLFVLVGWGGSPDRFAARADGADGDGPGAAEPMAVAIDLDALLFGNASNARRDVVWRVQPRRGNRIVYLPFTVDDVRCDSTLSRFPIDVAGGRFVGYVIPPPSDNAPRLNAFNIESVERVVNASPQELGGLLFGSADPSDPGAPGDPGVPSDLAGRDPSVDPLVERDVPDQAADQAADQPTPEMAPRLAREITLSADGTVRWEMDRSIQAAELQRASDRNLYAYKIDPEQLRAIQPDRAERLERRANEDSRDFAERRRAQQLAERERQDAFRELRSVLRALPETFSEPAPRVMYAAFELRERSALTIEGPSPLPWTLDQDKAQIFDQLGRGGNAFDGEAGEALAQRVITLIDGHPLDARAIALATTRSRLITRVQNGDAGYRVLARLLQSKDQPARRIALYNVATLTPPTLASAQLIGVASETAQGEERKMLSFASLGKLFETNLTQPDSARALIDRVSQTIADPQGPSATRVVQQVLAAIDSANQNNRAGMGDQIAQVMIEAIDLSALEKDEYAGVARAVVAQAPGNAVAAGWLDRHLLGSADRALVTETLSVLYESQMRPKVDPTATPSPGAPDERGAEPGVLLLAGTIPMVRADHALIELFDSGDDLQRAAAWAVLDRFHIALADPASVQGAGPASGAADGDRAVALFEAILAKADARDKVPAGVVTFVAQQTDASLLEPAADRLIEMLGDAQLPEKTASAALLALVDHADRLLPKIAAMDPKQQVEMLDAMYGSQATQAPLMAGVVAAPGQGMRWLVDYLGEHGTLPDASAWTAYAQSLGEGALLQVAASQDVSLATAGAAALVVAAGGDEQQQVAFASKVALMESRQFAAVSGEWDTQRAAIYASAFERAAGTYRLIVTLGQALAEGREAGPADEPAAQRIDLGVVELRVVEGTLSLSVESIQLSPIESRVGMRLNNPAALRAMNEPALSSVAPAQLAQPIELTPRAGDAWVGERVLPDGRSLRVSLEPVR